jgi:hypothetical protein
MFLGWILDHRLESDALAVNSAGLIASFRARSVTPGKLFHALDGTLTDEDLSEEGNAFARDYFDFDRGRYLADYEATVAKGLPSLYHVQDSWKNYEKMSPVIDRRYAEWKKRHSRM